MFSYRLVDGNGECLGDGNYEPGMFADVREGDRAFFVFRMLVTLHASFFGLTISTSVRFESDSLFFNFISRTCYLAESVVHHKFPS